MTEKAEAARKTLNELCKDFTATQILYFLGEMLLLEIDEKAEVQYDKIDEPHSFILRMSNGRVITVLVMDVLPPHK